MSLKGYCCYYFDQRFITDLCVFLLEVKYCPPLRKVLYFLIWDKVHEVHMFRTLNIYLSLMKPSLPLEESAYVLKSQYASAERFWD